MSELGAILQRVLGNSASWEPRSASGRDNTIPSLLYTSTPILTLCDTRVVTMTWHPFGESHNCPQGRSVYQSLSALSTFWQCATRELSQWHDTRSVKATTGLRDGACISLSPHYPHFDTVRHTSCHNDMTPVRWKPQLASGTVSVSLRIIHICCPIWAKLGTNLHIMLCSVCRVSCISAQGSSPSPLYDSTLNYCTHCSGSRSDAIFGSVSLRALAPPTCG